MRRSAPRTFLAAGLLAVASFCVLSVGACTETVQPEASGPERPSLPAPPPPRAPTSSDWSGEWRSGEPGDRGLDAARFSAAVERAEALPRIRSLIVLHEGVAVHESYLRGARRNAPHNIKSASKSVMSALVGIAVDQGILDLDQPVADFFPEHFDGDDDPRRDIRVFHFLTMTSGLETTSFRNYGAWAASRDPVQFALTRELQSPPGTRFRYSTGNTHVLSAILTRASGLSTREFAQRYLFGPMGIEPGGWDRDPKGIYLGGNNLALRPRDMAKFGQLYLDRGRWGDRQLVPWRWVDASIESINPGWPSRYGSYGLLWWIRPSTEAGSFVAIGYGGQYIYVAPRARMVVVVTSSHESKDRSWERRLFGEIHEMTRSVVVRPTVGVAPRTE